jgi:uncharacterized membrane protein YeaQ/YmgE (transglycosylase-associated protein family)
MPFDRGIGAGVMARTEVAASMAKALNVLSIHCCGNLAVDLDQRSPEPRNVRNQGGASHERGDKQMGILSWIVLGLIAGFIGSKIVNRQGQGFWLDIGLGIIGAIVGGYLFSFFGKEGVSGLNLYSMCVAVAGSIVVLLLYNLLTGRRHV